MDFISTGTEILKQENVLTPRQKDIIDTEKEMLKSPFDRNTAIGQVEKNCMSYPELALGVTVPIAINSGVCCWPMRPTRQPSPVIWPRRNLFVVMMQKRTLPDLRGG